MNLCQHEDPDGSASQRGLQAAYPCVFPCVRLDGSLCDYEEAPSSGRGKGKGNRTMGRASHMDRWHNCLGLLPTFEGPSFPPPPTRVSN